MKQIGAILTVLVSVAAMCTSNAAVNASVTTNGTEVTIDVSGGYSGEFVVKDVYGSDITKLIKTGENVASYVPDEAPSYGELEIRRGQLRVKRADQLGLGAVTLSGEGSIMLNAVSVKIPNKVVFGNELAYVAAFGSDDAQITLTSIGSSQAAGSRTALLGRANGGYSKSCLALTGADSEAMDRLNVRGTTDLTLDGGAVKIAGEALSPFFADADNGAYTKRYFVTTNGVTVDVASGADVSLGIAPTFPVVSVTRTNVVDAAGVENGGFSSNLTGWTIDKGTSTATSSIQNNGSAFDTCTVSGWEAAWTTTNSPYLMLRVNQSVSRKIAVPSDGLWRVVFDQGCRPGNNWYSVGDDMATTVSVADSSGVVGSTTFPAPSSQAKRYGFKRFETNPAKLTAGEYDLTVALSYPAASDVNLSMNFDSFRLEKVEIVTNSYQGALTKTGAGALCVSGITNAPIAVQAGTLRFERETLDALSVSVTEGALDAGSIQLSEDSVIRVAAGGTLRFSSPDYTNELVNGNFEADGSYSDATSKGQITGWKFAVIQSTDLNKNGSGLQGNGGNVTTTAPWSPDSAGPVTAYLREDCRVSQSFTLAQSGKYTLSFLKACRDILYSTTMPLKVMIDDTTEIYSSTTNNKDEYEFCSVELTLEAGSHTVSFESGEPTARVSVGAMVFIDDVRLMRHLPQEELTTGEIRLASGSTLQLDNASKVFIRNFYVNDVRVNGGRRALENAGVTVTGSGAIRVGDQAGLSVIFR